MRAKLLPVGVGLAAVALGLGFGLAGRWVWLLAVALVGGGWLAGWRRGWSWGAPLGLVGYVALAAAGLLLGVGAGWMLAGAVAALVAWDLDEFVRRLNSVEWVERRRDLERQHLLRLLGVAGLGSLLAAVALAVQLRLSLGLVLLLGLAAILGLSRAVGFLRREGEEQ